MDRRAALRILGTAGAVPFVSPEWLALGRSVHARARANPNLHTLTPEQDALVTTLAELILPATDTPGAKAARVNEFIDLILTEWYTPQERERFLAGLADVDRRSQAACGRNFVEATAAQQTELLTVLDAEVTGMREAERIRGLGMRRPGPRPSRTHFFYVMKRLTVFGYYTSEIGATQELKYQIFFDQYQPCAPLEEGLKAPEG